MIRLFIACVWVGHAAAAPLPVEDFKPGGEGGRPWGLPGGSGLAVAAGASSSLQVAVPPLTDKEREEGGAWHGVISLDLYGTEDGNEGEVSLEAVAPATGESFARTRASVGGKAPRAAEKEMPHASGGANARVWLWISPGVMAGLEGKSFELRLKNSAAATVVVGAPRLARLHTAPSAKLFSRVNGANGPDQLGAGLLGFTALTEHKQDVLGVISVAAESPSAKAGLKAGDVIVGISNRPLPLNTLAPGWEWFHQSHEAVIGRAIENALKAGDTKLPLTVLRDGKPAVLDIALRRKEPFSTLNPATDPQAAALLADQIAFLERTQRDDGSWSGDIIRTTFSALALMATRDVKHRDRVAKAVDWAMRKYPRPESYGHLSFWPGSYACILYSEWHLATGDEAVLPRLSALRDWALTANFICRWDVRALGHGVRGIPYDKRALVAPACHLLVFEALAMRCGMESGVWELIMPYMELSWSDPAKGGHGALGYNPSFKDKREFWSRSGLFAIASHLRGERTDMRDAMIGFMGKNHPWFRASHAYGEPGGALGLLALNLITPAVFASVLPEYGWSFGLGWEPGHGLRYTHPHMGSLHMGDEDLMNACYALVLQAPKRSLHLTGTTEKGYWAVR